MRSLKRSIATLLILAVISSLLAVSVFAAGGYSITVGNTEFKSGEDKSGDGWSYTASSNTLTLNGYSGSSVVSDGDISIVISGNTAISGKSLENYSSFSAGISVSGKLTLTVGDMATANISGADNSSVRGGDGIVASTLILKSSDSSDLNISGGNISSGIGGFGIKANNITFEASNLVVNGGNGASAVYFASSFNVKNGSCATLISGDENISAITYLSGASYSYDSKVTSTFIKSDGNSTVYISTVGLFVYGDMNSDTQVDAKDAVLLAQYLASWNIALDQNALSAADIFYTGTVDARDAVLLAQYLAGWNVDLGR